MRQIAPDPTVLYELVELVRYRPGWTFKLADIDRGQDVRTSFRGVVKLP